MSLQAVSGDTRVALYSLHDADDKKKPVNPDEPNQQGSTLASKIVEWIRADRPFYQQVVVYSLVACAALALIVSCVGIPFVADVAEEHKKQEEAERLKLLDQPIIALLGGESVYNQMPVLRFHDKDASSAYSRPHLQDLTSSKMRGTDKYNRPVLFFKVFDRTTRTDFVEMIYRKYSQEGSNNPWIKNPSERSIFGGELVIEGRSLQRLDDVLHGKHHSYSISRH